MAVVGLVALGISLGHLRLPVWLAWPPTGIAAFAGWWWIRTDQTLMVLTHGPTMSLALLVLPVLAILPRWASTVEVGRRGRERLAVGSFAVFVMLLPLTAAFGSNNNVWMTQGRMTVFWVLATTLVLVRRSTLLGTIPALATQLLLAAYMVGAVLNPYRYPSALTADTPSPLTAYAASGQLTAEDAGHLGDLLALGSRLGIDDDTWIFDLTGENPGLIHSSGARAVGQAWILGGYSRSEAGAELVLKLDACRLSTALVLDAPEGPRRLDPSMLDAVGLSLERDYDEVGTFQWMRWEGSTQSARFIPGRLLAPRAGLDVPAYGEQR